MKSVHFWWLVCGAPSLLATGCLGTDLPGDAPSDGRCGSTPRLLASASSYPVTPGAVVVWVSAIAVEGSDLYYVLSEEGASPPGFDKIEVQSPGAVMRVPAAGGQPVQVAGGYLFQPPVFTPARLILQEAAVNPNGSVEAAAIVLLPRGGGSPTTLVDPLSDKAASPFGPPPVTDGTFVYYVSGNRAVEAIPVDPASPGVQPTPIGQSNPSGMSVVGQHLLLVTGEDLESISLPAGAGSNPTPLVFALAGDGDPIPCGASACWLDPTSSLLEIDPAGGYATAIADLSSHFFRADGVAFDGATFFVSGSAYSPVSSTVRIADKGAIARVPWQGGSPIDVVVTARGSNVGPFTVDDECLYYSTPTGIYSVSKAATGAVSP